MRRSHTYNVFIHSRTVTILEETYVMPDFFLVKSWIRCWKFLEIIRI